MEFKKEIMNRKHYAFYHLTPNPSPKGEGSDSPLRFGEGLGVR